MFDVLDTFNLITTFFNACKHTVLCIVYPSNKLIVIDCTVVEIRIHVFERRRRDRAVGSKGRSKQERVSEKEDEKRGVWSRLQFSTRC